MLRQEASPSKNTLFGRLRGQVAALFASSSAISTGNGDNSSKGPSPRIGLRLFSSGRDENVRRQREIPSDRRSRTSTGSFIDPEAPPTDPIQPFSPNHIPSREMEQGHAHRAQTNSPTSASQPLTSNRLRGAWVRLPRKEREPTVKRYCCRPGLKTRAARRKLIDCLVAGLLLAIVLALYLALAVSSSVAGREFHVILILVLMLLTIYFCHSLIRFLMLVSRPIPDYQTSQGLAPRIGSIGYAHPQHPIPVVFARDEEMLAEVNENGAISQSQPPMAAPPPAYGLWRSSVKINPNLVHWQRNNHQRRDAPGDINDTDERPATVNRPPSYVTEDGVRYVIDIQPRPQAVTQPEIRAPEIALIHPSERDRPK
ncbi:hypothetical protein AJ80_05012 [Polytolypa hystricis UAMH7299]|uniref:Uncharacterized protein n=1 Tax=Polytolypa hystricis (strain UAMH7299) TaxID=1447883 RepID=A0A2B7XYR8_POLH7|nr:hypothetical protein AJ80_05012 [Polytolypa hystricis UAMH7299]